ncbi:MAG: ROK family protein [Clostridiales bacterium]|nr:ROK family protein [Clostridiales bacterium]
MRVSGKVGNVRLMQCINRARVVECIRREGITTRPGLAAQTNLSLSSITNIVTYLMDSGYVTEQLVTEGSGKVGRRASQIALARDPYRVACVEMETGYLRGSLLSLTGEVIRTLPADRRMLTGDEAVRAVFDCLKELYGKPDGELLAAAVSVPGMVLDRGHSVASVKLGWNAVDLRTPLEAQRGELPVFIQNASIARAIRVRETIRRDKPRNALFLDLAHGVGAVHFAEAVLDATFLGELGHVTADVHGERCFCGNRGCLEMFCSPERIAAEYGADTYAQVLTAYARGDERAEAALRRGGRYLGAALVTLIQLYAPDIIYINGHELLKSPIVAQAAETYAKSHAYTQLVSRVRFEYVSLDERATLEGLMEYALDRLFDIESSNCILE